MIDCKIEIAKILLSRKPFFLVNEIIKGTYKLRKFDSSLNLLISNLRKR